MQTEDSGLTRLYVTTHLFLEGTILSTSRMQYLADEPDEVVQKKMQVQHKTMLKRLRDGDFDHGQEGLSSAPLPGLVADSGAEHSVPREVAVDSAEATLRLAVPGGKPEPARAVPPIAATSDVAVTPIAAQKASELTRAPVPATGPILAPVAPPPVLPRPAASGTLAERLRRPAGSGAPPLPGNRGAASVPPAAPRAADPQSVLEFEADLPDDEDDLEPAVTIEVTEPAAADLAPADPTLTYGASMPPPTAALPTPAGPAGQAGRHSQSGLLRVPSPATAVIPQPAVPPPPVMMSAPPLAARPLPSSVQRAKPTAEGVVLQRTLGPTTIMRSGADSLRTTSPRARPTAPAPLAVAQPLHPLEDDRSLDPVVLAYLAREVRPRE